MNTMTLEDFKKNFPQEYQKFIEENPDTGYLKVAVYTAYKAIPIINAKVSITKQIAEKNILFFEGYTNESGMIENIELPAPIAKSATSETPPQYTVYNIKATQEEYEDINSYNIGMFGGIKIIQNIKMTPKVNFKGVTTNGN